MATSKIAVTEGSGKNVSTYSISEDAVTKEIGRQTLNNSSGTEIGTSANPIEVNLRSSTISLPAGTNLIGGINNVQINGNTISASNGVTDVGTQRVTLSSDSTGQVKLAANSGVDIGKLTANQSVNNAQVSGTAVSVNNGTVDAGTQRVTLASDSTGLVKLATGTNSIGNVGTLTTTVNVGQQTSNTSAVQISAASTVPGNGIVVQALSTNAASIFVGGSGVTTSTGFELQKGQAISFTCNLNTLYIIGANNTDKICYNVE